MNTVMHNKRILTTSLLAVGLGLTCTVSYSVFADGTDVVDEIGIGVPISCTLSGTGMSSHTATIPNGIYSGSYTADGVDYTDGIGSTTLKAMCNDNEGFAIYAAGYTGDEIGGTNSTNLVGTSASGNSIITTGTATGPVGSDDISNWAMKLNTVTSPAPTYPITIDGGFNSYSAVPSSYTKVAHRDSATDIGPNGVGSTLTTTYAAYISKNQPADTYSGKVIYTLVHPANEEPLQPQQATAGCINYFANASNAIGTMGCHDTREIDWSSCYNTDNDSYCYDEDWNEIDVGTLPRLDSHNTTQILLASNYSRNGYGFAGWSDKYDYATNANAKFFGPQETVIFSEDALTNGISLYAVWIKSAGNLQDSSKVAELCGTGTGSLIAAPTDGTANLSSVSALTDQRDNETYAIAKLADGRCWMIENLRLDNSASLTLSNTNNPLNDGTNVTLKHSYSDTDTHNTLSASQDPTVTAWCQSNSASCDDQSMLFTGSTTNRASYETGATMTNSANIYSYGNYYNWYSATAGRGTYSFSTNNNSVAGDLCPAGWRLPKGGDKTRITSDNDNEFWTLTVTYLNGGTLPANYDSQTRPYYTGTAEAGPVADKLRSYPNNFVYSGYIYGGSVNNRGLNGYLWSSTAFSFYNAYDLHLNLYAVYPGTGNGSKYSGTTVRCVAPGV